MLEVKAEQACHCPPDPVVRVASTSLELQIEEVGGTVRAATTDWVVVERALVVLACHRVQHVTLKYYTVTVC